MKKNILVLATVLLISLGAFAQRGSLRIGGGLGFEIYNLKNNYLDSSAYKKFYEGYAFSIAPHAEYMLTDNISIIGGLSYTTGKSTLSNIYNNSQISSIKYNSFGFNLGARKYWNLNDKFAFYAGVQFSMNFGNDKVEAYDIIEVGEINLKIKTNSLNAFIYPGISYKLSDRIALYAQYGTLGYSYSIRFNADNKDVKTQSNKFGFNLNNDVLQFGFMFKI